MRPRNRWPHRLLLSRMKKRGSGDPSSPGSSLALAVDAAHAEVFDLEKFLDAVFRAFAADAAFLHTAEGGDLGRDDALVDADDAVLEPPRPYARCRPGHALPRCSPNTVPARKSGADHDHRQLLSADVHSMGAEQDGFEEEFSLV